MILARAICAAGAGLMALGALAPARAEDLPGKPILEFRLRSETVQQDGYGKEADALTLRTHLGYETTAWRGFIALVEGENITALDDSYNSTTNNRTHFPVVTDPEVTELNRAQVAWTGQEGEAVIGRQRIVLGNARFISNALFRQNEQTFDAAKLLVRPTGELTVTYAYIGYVHRILGDGSPQGNWDSDSHVIQAELKTPAGLLSGYGYLLAFDNAAIHSSATWGARLAGSRPLKPGLAVTYEAELARQTDYRNSPTAFALGYLNLGLGLSRGPTSAGVKFEHLDSDGRRGFETPLAFFQAWSDIFFTTPQAGISDWSLRAATSVALGPRTGPLKLQAVAHDFADSAGSQRYGRELDMSAGIQMTPRLNAEIRGAFFDGVQTGFADRTRIWLTLEAKY